MVGAGLDRSSRAKMAFSARLRQLRLAADLTQKDLERLCGIPKSRISQYENGHLLPSFRGLRKLAESMGVPESTLLGETDEHVAAFTAALHRHGVDIDSAERAEEIAGAVASVMKRKALRAASAPATGL